jgi:hypothetical protein
LTECNSVNKRQCTRWSHLYPQQVDAVWDRHAHRGKGVVVAEAAHLHVLQTSEERKNKSSGFEGLQYYLLVDEEALVGVPSYAAHAKRGGYAVYNVTAAQKYAL